MAKKLSVWHVQKAIAALNKQPAASLPWLVPQWFAEEYIALHGRLPDGVGIAKQIKNLS